MSQPGNEPKIQVGGELVNPWEHRSMPQDNSPSLGGQGERTGDEPELGGQAPKCKQCGTAMRRGTETELVSSFVAFLHGYDRINGRIWVKTCECVRPDALQLPAFQENILRELALYGRSGRLRVLSPTERYPGFDDEDEQAPT